ncbi:MAG: Rpn family recombination-promoting nuclease/putative transposase, partial [Natronospirillum sp.]
MKQPPPSSHSNRSGRNQADSSADSATAGPHNPYANSYKLLFSHPEMIADLLRGYVREPWVEQLDFSTLQRGGEGYVSDDLREREDDIIWRVRWGDQWLYVYLLLEFQSTVDPYMAVRIMTYLGLLYQDLVRQGERTPSGKLPPVLPVVLYNGQPVWHAATDVADLIDDVPGGLGRYKPHLHYLLLDEKAYRDESLPAVQNLVSALFGLENSAQPDDVGRVLNALVEWVKAPPQRSVRRAFLVWLKQVFLPGRMPGVEFEQMQDLHEVQTMLAERVKDWTQTWEQQGIE